MGDLETLAKARRELQDLYLGVPDDSVNLSFQELAQVTQRKAAAFSSQLSQKKKSSPTASETSSKLDKPPSLAKLPSLDFSRALEASSTHNLNPNYKISHHIDHPLRDDPMFHGSSNLHHHRDQAHADHAMNGQAGHHSIHYGHAREVNGDDHHAMNGHADHQIHHHHHQQQQQHHHAINGHADHQIHHHHQQHIAVDRSMGYVDDDMSHMSGMTMAATPYQGRRRRPGIPHSNICTLCSTYIYIFRYRCLVCGRVYCRQCVRIGMGDMVEGRKCVECLGRRFSQRYIHKAGQMGCCMGYPSTVRQQELKWAEKGPSRSGENRPGRSGMVSSSRNPVVSATRTPARVHTPGTPPSIRVHTPNTPPSFVINSPRSPYTPTRHHPLPF